MRGNFEESISSSDGCYLAGVYERHPIDYHERLPGFARSSDTRVPVADGKYIAVVLGDDVLDPAACECLDFERVLDLRSGCLSRRTTLRTPQGARLRIESERLVLLGQDLLAIRFRVTSLDYDGPLTLVSKIRAGQHSAQQSEDPRIGTSGSRTLETVAATAGDIVAALAQRTRHSGIAVACAQAHRLGGEGLESSGCETDDHHVAQHFRGQMRPGKSVTLEKFVAYASGGEDPAPLIERATACARAAGAGGYAQQAATQASAFAGFWRHADIVVDGDPRTQLALRFNLFHLLQSASRSDTHGTAAKGLTGEGYEGHCFWDTEVYVLPVIVFTAPEVARSMLMYRYRALDAARSNAREMNHGAGALYPWRTIAGGECSAHYPSGSAAYHINADIAYAIGLYLDASDDIGFLLEAGAEMLFETARIWPQVGHHDPLRAGAFGIHAVTGPDEYTALVDNNFYTNRMAQRHLQRAVAVWEQMSKSHPNELRTLAQRLSLDESEIAVWRAAAESMLLQVDAHYDIWSQDDTFLHKPHWNHAAHAGARPLLLDYHPLTLYRHQVCKQGDVVMALVLAGDGLDAARKRRSFDYYEAITTHDSTLSPSIHGILASEVGLHDKALEYFQETLHVDLDDLHGNTHHGVHMAAMAGTWLGVAWGFAGLRVVGGVLEFAPALPAGWRGYRFGLHWRGRRLAVEVSPTDVVYRLVDGDELQIAHRGRPQLLAREASLRIAMEVEPQRPNSVFPCRCEALIFDLDGVLTDTARMHYLAWKRLADEIGVPFDETVNQRLKGIDRAASLRIILERSHRRYDAAELRVLAERKNGYYLEAIAGFGPGDLFPGVDELLLSARRAGLRLALASASRNAPLLLRRLGIGDAFDAIADPATATPKPAPDLFLAAAAALGVDPRHCIGIEDAAAGIAAIHAAGMAAVGIGEAEELPQADMVCPAISELRLEAIVAPRESGCDQTALGCTSSIRHHSIKEMA